MDLRGGGNGVNPSNSGHSEGNNNLIPEESHKRENIEVSCYTEEQHLQNSNSSPQRGEEAILSEQERTLGVQVRGQINSEKTFSKELSCNNSNYTEINKNLDCFGSKEPHNDGTNSVILSGSETIQPIVNQTQLQGNKYAPTSKSKISVLPQGVDMRANSLAPCGRGQGEGLRAAFTLAEVLITLGIIGIVAALTLPSVIAKYQKEQTVVQLKKAYSTLDNAARLSTVYNGEMQTWDSNLFNTNIKEYVATYYLPYINGEKNTNWVDKNYVIHNLNGRTLMDFQSQARTTMVKTVNSQMFIFSQTQIGQGYLWIFADINGTKGPNRIGRDVFVFDGRNYATGDKYYIKFWGQTPWWGREELVGDNISEDLQNSGGYGCSKENKYGLYAGYYCGALIMLDGWQIKQDYPW